MRKWIATVLLAAVGGLMTAPFALGTPANKAAVERYFGRFLGKNLQNCSLCHLPSDKKEPESLEEFPHNTFGEALRVAGKQLKAEGKRRDMAARLEIVGAADSDGDGVDNVSEILLGHNPGDAKDKPSAEEMKELAGWRAAFSAFLKSYRWEPYEIVKRPEVPRIGAAKPQAAGDGNAIDAFIEGQRRADWGSGAP